MCNAQQTMTNKPLPPPQRAIGVAGLLFLLGYPAGASAEEIELRSY